MKLVDANVLIYAVAVLRRRLAVERLPRAGAVAIALWVLTGYVLFSRSRGVVYTRYFEVLDYIPQGMMGRQDIILMRRPG